MNLRRTGRVGWTLALTGALLGATLLPAQAAPKDSKAELTSAAKSLAKQAQLPLTVAGGSSSSCKTWSADANYTKAFFDSINFVRGLAGVSTVTSNAALNEYAGKYTNSNCSYPTNPGYSIDNFGWKILPGDPGSVRKAINEDDYSRAALLSTNAKYAALGVSKQTYTNVAREYSFVSSSSSADYLTRFSKNVAWPGNGYFPVELSNGIWSFFGKNTGQNSDLNLSNATITVQNSSGTKLAVEKLTSGWYSGTDELHFKVPAATVGKTAGSEASYKVTISGIKDRSYPANNVSNVTYTVKLVRTGASFAYKNQAPKFTKQPASKLSVKVDDYVKVSAGVYVPAQQDVSYQWQYKRKGEKKWNTIYFADSPSAKITPQGLSLNGSVVRLKVESAGITKYSNNITLKVTKYASKVKITKTTLKKGKKPVVTVKASQAGKVKVTVAKGKTKITKTVSVKKNKALKVTLPKKISKSSGKGKWKVTAKFSPTKSSLYAGKSTSKTVTVK